ncbi:MAG: hypothetical protein HDQ96_00485 [Lachnospiraceae bacterium]|nr:hypothetical protein [Lachnospiraceae bacterium]
MKNSIKIIRISLFSVLSLILGGYVIVEYIDNMKMRSVFFVILCIAVFLLVVILAKSSKCAIQKVMVLDFFNGAIFIGIIVIFISPVGILGKGLSEMNKIQNTFQGNNEFLSSYSKSIGGKGYEDIESAVSDAIEYREESLGQSGLKEIYRTQVGEKVYIYLKETEEIIEIEFFRQNDLYYRSGSKVLSYAGLLSSDSYTMEETMKKDIANTMWRGIDYKEVRLPAWGVSCDEQISSTTINGAKMDDVLQVDEISGKKYYFWITTNVEGIETIDDVDEIKIESDKVYSTIAFAFFSNIYAWHYC